MKHTIQSLSPEALLENITLAALSALALGPADRVSDIAPLEASLPLIAKAWDLPEPVLAEKTERLERAKKLAVENKGGLPGEKLLECRDGSAILAPLWALFKTAVCLDSRPERQAIYDVSALLYEALNLPGFLIPSGQHKVKILGGIFRNVVYQDSRMMRESSYAKAVPWMERLFIYGIAKVS